MDTDGLKRPVVLDSLETSTGDRCVDIFRRADGSFGFEEYRRDPEDGRGWFPIGNYIGQVFETRDAAIDEARRRVVWVDGVLGKA